MRRSPKQGSPLCFVAIVVVAGVLRAWNLKWHLPAVLHPDEHVIVNSALGFGSGDLNPHFFIYGSLLMYLAFISYGLYFVAGHLCGYFPSVDAFAVRFFLDPTWFYLAPRVISAAAGTITVILTYLISRQSFSLEAGLLSAALLAVHAESVRQAHYALPVTLATCLVTGALYRISKITGDSQPRLLDIAGAGVLFGLAVSTHLLASVVAFGAGLWLAWYYRKLPRQCVSAGATLAAGAIAGMFVGEPFFFLDFPNAYREILGWTSLVASSGHSVTQSLLIAGGNILNNLSYTGTIFLATGVLVSAYRSLRCAGLLITAATGYIGFLAYRGFPEPRYLSMIAPVLCVLAGVGLATFLDFLVLTKRQYAKILAAATVCVLLAHPAAKAVTVARSFGMPDTRLLARSWIHENIAPGSRLLLEGPEAALPPLLENPQRLWELENSAAGKGRGRYRHLQTYFRYKRAAVEIASEPTYWILRLKHVWWANREDKKEAGKTFNMIPPTTHLEPRSLAYYQSKGIKYVITTDDMIRAYDNRRFPRARQFYSDLRRVGRLVHVETRTPGIQGPEVQVWQIGNGHH